MKRVAGLSFLVVFLLAIGLILWRPNMVGVRQAGSDVPGETVGYFSGTLSDGREVQIKLLRKDKETTAGVHLQGLDKSFLLTGANQTQGRFQLSIRKFEVAAPGQISVLVGQVSGEPPVLRGTATLGKKSEPITAQKIAIARQYVRKKGLHVAGRGGGKEFSSVWPEFLSKTPFHHTISERLTAEARGETDKFAAGALDNMWEGLKGGGQSWNYDGVLDSEIVLFSPDLVSIAQERYEYTGGAHGMTEHLGRNFVARNGKVKEFALPELFKPGSAWLKTISDACLRDLRRKKASAVVDGDIKGFNVQQLQTFTVNGAGLTICFAEYAVGCYAEGAFYVLVPWRDLRPILNPSGPAQHIPGALQD